VRDVARGAGQSDIDGVGVAAEIVTGFEQREVGLTPQAVSDSKARDTGTNNCDFHDFERSGYFVTDRYFPISISKKALCAAGNYPAWRGRRPPTLGAK
jgi:hypothetical protein